jgi:hypothetical protein
VAVEPIREVNINPVRIGATDPSWFAAGGLVVADPVALARGLGFAEVDVILNALPALRQGGVQGAATGVIQDPAGSAVGSGTTPGGGGASGAICSRFPDLEPIDAIAPRSAIFNRSTGPGRRVLHTHSPRLAGNPENEAVRNKVLEDLANAYYNALVSVEQRSAALGEDGKLLNLVPVSASIYAGRFAKNEHGTPHLDCSYTLTAIMIAIGKLLTKQQTIVALTLSYFSPHTYEAASALVATLKNRDPKGPTT